MNEEMPYDRCEEDCPYIEDGECTYRDNHVSVVAVDFDKVLFKHSEWNGHNHHGELIENAKESLEELIDMGFKVMIWTTRAQKDILRKILNEYNLPFDYINENPNEPPEINPSKPVADYYIDDRAVHFTNWEETIEKIKKREQEGGYYPQDESKSESKSTKEVVSYKSRALMIASSMAIYTLTTTLITEIFDGEILVKINLIVYPVLIFLLIAIVLIIFIKDAERKQNGDSS